VSLKPVFSRQARRQIARLARSSPDLLNRIVEVVSHLVHQPITGLHQPKPLVGDLQGWWSVRLNHKDRLIYRVESDELQIDSVEGHYGDH